MNEKLMSIIKESTSIAEVLRKIGKKPSGGNYAMIKQQIRINNVNTEHWLGQASNKGKTHNHSYNKIPLEEILIRESLYANTHSLKKRLIKEGILPNFCQMCNLKTWLEKPISIQLDHINGNRTDNRIENLRILCPNCHSQTETYCGKKLKLPDNKCLCGKVIKRKSKSCGRCMIKLPGFFEEHAEEVCKCGNEKIKESKQCKSCFNENRSFKIKWPENSELLILISNNSYLEVGRLLGVTDVAVRKHLTKNGIIVPKKQKSRV